MDFSFNINELFKEEFTIIENVLDFCRKASFDMGRDRLHHLQNKVYEVVNKMGEASAKAQGLHTAITTGRKLTATGHRLYIMKDSSDKSGHGSIVGILKVGIKKLFVYDNAKVQHEIEPLCVLDFYVHESRQRMGSGRKLFDFMLDSEHVSAQHLAIDRPSPKLLSFMEKHYKLRKLIPQVYNFVVFEGFFYNRAGWARRHSQVDKDTMKGNPNNPNQWTRQANLRQQESHLGASQWMYSRHGTVTSAGCHGRPLSSKNCYLHDPRSAQHRAAYDHHNFIAATEEKCFQPELLSPKQRSQGPVGYSILTSNNLQGSTRGPDSGDHTRHAVSSPVVIDVNYLPHIKQTTPSLYLSDVSTNHQSPQRPQSLLSFSGTHPPARGTQGYLMDREGLSQELQQHKSPVIREREFPQVYYERDVQQSAPAGSSVSTISDTYSLLPKTPVTFGGHGNLSTGSESSNHHSSWTVAGVLQKQQLNPRSHASSLHNLWGHKYRL